MQGLQEPQPIASKSFSLSEKSMSGTRFSAMFKGPECEIHLNKRYIYRHWIDQDMTHSVEAGLSSSQIFV